MSSRHELLMKQATLYKIPQATRQVQYSRQVDSRMEQKSSSSRKKKKRTSKSGTGKIDKELAKQMLVVC